MNIFFGILATIMFLLLFAEKNDSKRKHITWGFIAVVGAIALITVVKMFTF